MDLPPRQMLLTAVTRFRSSKFLPPQTLDQAEKLMSPATALVLLRFCIGWFQMSYHARAMHPDSLHLHLCAKKMQTSLIRCLGGLRRAPGVDQEKWRRHQGPGTPLSSGFPGHQVLRHCVTGCGTAPRPTRMWWQPVSSFKPPSTTSQHDTQAVQSRGRASDQTCVTHARSTL